MLSTFFVFVYSLSKAGSFIYLPGCKNRKFFGMGFYWWVVFYKRILTSFIDIFKLGRNAMGRMKGKNLFGMAIFCIKRNRPRCQQASRQKRDYKESERIIWTQQHSISIQTGSIYFFSGYFSRLIYFLPLSVEKVYPKKIKATIYGNLGQFKSI